VTGWDRGAERRAEFTRAEKRSILRVHGRICHRCQRGGATEVDHVVPIAEGGLNDPSNGRPIHEACHRAKSREETRRGLERRAAKRKLPPDVHPFYGKSPNDKHPRSGAETV
jgi:5-methylcytosine-specific restriction protein A